MDIEFNMGVGAYRVLSDVTYICEVPQALGRVTKFERRNGKLTAVTESGIEMIVPISGPPRDDAA